MQCRTACDLAQLIHRRDLSAIEVVEQHLAAIERHQPRLNAFVEIRAEAARDEARAIDRHAARGVARPLEGVPISVKSSIQVAGLRTESGSRAHAGETAHRDAPVVERLRRAGAIVLGTTNVPEMLMGYETVNPLYGRTNNPWDVERTPGGSSGGEAAAIASGCSAAGIGGDAAGSLRVPAHFTGICALKPTPGRIPATGHVPVLTGPMGILGVIGPMARSVADLRLLLEVAAGVDAGDALSAPVPVAPAPDVRGSRVSVGWFEDDGEVPVTGDTRAAVRAAIDALADAGLATGLYIPPEIARAKELWSLFLGKFGQAQLVDAIAGANVGVPFLKALDSTRVMRDTLTPHSLAHAWRERDDLRARLLKGMERYPVMVCPVAAIPAFRHGEREWTIEGRTVGYVDAMSYSVWVNIMGNPAVVVPAGQSKTGLPIGVQVVARPWEEPLALAVAALIEERLGAGGLGAGGLGD